MTSRVSPIAAPGSLFKVPRESRPRKPKKEARERNANYLARVRRCPCLACDNDPARVAAHLRLSGDGKPMPGTGAKPDDKWTLPLCSTCHTAGPEAQHEVGEVRFWDALGLDPKAIALRLYMAAPNIDAMRAVIFEAREGRK